MKRFFPTELKTSPTVLNRFSLWMGLCLVSINLLWFTYAAARSNTFIPGLPGINLTVSGGLGTLLSQGAGSASLQPLFGLFATVLLVVAGSGLVISAGVYSSRAPGRRLFFIAYPLYLLHCINTDWLFVQHLQFSGTKWLLAMAVCVVFAVKATLSLISFVLVRALPCTTTQEHNYRSALVFPACSALFTLYLIKIIVA